VSERDNETTLRVLARMRQNLRAHLAEVSKTRD